MFRVPNGLPKLHLNPLLSRRMSLLQLSTQGRVQVPRNSQVQLTEVEEKICLLLDECTTWMKQTGGGSNTTTCRIAGGWVRDKVNN